MTPVKPNEPEKPAVQTNRSTLSEKAAGTGRISAPVAQNEKTADKSRKVERSGSITQQRKAWEKSDEGDNQSESNRTVNTGR
jgi:hypothetical protein